MKSRYTNYRWWNVLTRAKGTKRWYIAAGHVEYLEAKRIRDTQKALGYDTKLQASPE
jgi:hypothetical protein